ncbi:hypothetical protein [Paraburkholderia heleia]|uniref:hypothetical protein n=1 Tax=Paraburkholderia heleia TaxID=634127 RepID=UPI002AB63874|nr:hypothetical protein [Paraburkholderia heleia]
MPTATLYRVYRYRALQIVIEIMPVIEGKPQIAVLVPEGFVANVHVERSRTLGVEPCSFRLPQTYRLFPTRDDALMAACRAAQRVVDDAIGENNLSDGRAEKPRTRKMGRCFRSTIH